MNRLSHLLWFLLVPLVAGFSPAAGADFSLPSPLLDKTASLKTLLKAADVNLLAEEAKRRGDAERGAIVFATSAAACAQCHGQGEDASPLGPDLALAGPETTAQHLIESLLYPSRVIKQGYETLQLLTVDGKVWQGMAVSVNDDRVVLRDASDLSQTVTISQDEIEEMTRRPQSMMPEGLVASLGGQPAFLDLVAYLLAIAQGGPAEAARLQPSQATLAALDDTANLDHAGIIQGMRGRDFTAGEQIYQGYCANCHGADGNRPSLPTARAFGTDPLKFGADPYKMFLTLTQGNGLMGPMSHLLPRERYQVIHYIREAFMKGKNPDYFAVDDTYLAGLPAGTDDGASPPVVERDYGPALASQLRRDFESVLTVRLPRVGPTDVSAKPLTISYDLHSMDQAGIWEGGFLDLSNTQHMRGRGEGTADPEGAELAGLAGWQWGHEQTLDYPREDLLPRGPLPRRWLDYRGHYLHDDEVVFRYRIDGREVFELPSQRAVAGARQALRHAFHLGPGPALRLAVARGSASSTAVDRVAPAGGLLARADTKAGAAEGSVAFLSTGQADAMQWTAAMLGGECEGMRWEIDAERRLVLHLPASTKPRRFAVERAAGGGRASLQSYASAVRQEVSETAVASVDPRSRTRGGSLRWPDVLETTGYRGLQQGAYALDTLTIPAATPWNTWFRTSALDFLPDGRMVVSTYGGDIWIVSGVDDQLLQLRWKRFAAGMYEPFGVKVIDGQIYVTCKDRLTRLHDLNDDGEADFYESFCPETDVSVNFHSFNFDLQVDSQGNFYYAKSGHGGDFALPGAVLEISPDGAEREVYCTGFRSPNGMGILPDDRLTVSDNQGQWMPASKINLLRRGGFYGWVPTYGYKDMWAPDGGALDLSEVVPPETFDPPLVYMPQDFDNSSGGQVWAGDPRWGPLTDHLLHTSFGKGWMSYLSIQDFEGGSQAAIIKLPLDFQTGIMRARVNPIDGQVYATGLDGWNGGGRVGMGDKGIQRVRYTGRPQQLIDRCRVVDGGLRLSFRQPLDPAVARDPAAYQITHWNYRWAESYGSAMYSPTSGEVGFDSLAVAAVDVAEDGRTVTLQLPGLQPVDQLRLQLTLQNAEGTAFVEEIFWTIHHVPGQQAETAATTALGE